MDELGNENPDTRQSTTVKFDNNPPNPFTLDNPGNGEWGSPKPRFYFEEKGDVPSGIETFHLFINNIIAIII